MAKLKIFFRLVFLFVATLTFPAENSAQVSLPKVFGDNMVLQRDIEIPIWGNAAPGTNVVVELGSARVGAKTGLDGKWTAKLPKFKAGGPYLLKVYENGKTNQAIELKNILTGDVWLASGQSNMEWAVNQSFDAENETAKAHYPQIRLINVGHDVKFAPQEDIVSGEWKVCDSLNVAQFSAVAYYFARNIHHDHRVPVGIIQSTWGGTPVEAWTSRDMLLTSSLAKSKVLANDTLTPAHLVKDSQDLARFWEIVLNPQNNADEIVPKPDYDDAGWATVEMPKTLWEFGIGAYEGVMWFRKDVSIPETLLGKPLSLELGNPEMNYSLYFNGAEICKTVWNANPSHRYNIPAELVKSGKNTIALRIAMLWGGGGLKSDKDSVYITDGSLKVPLAGIWKYSKNVEPMAPKIQNYHYRPNVLFNAMINPVIPFGIKGFIWYQGEANEFDAYNYRKLFPMLITDWRQRWGMGNLPFLYVQLANFKSVKPVPAESEWAELREAQTLTLSQPNTGMACIIDIGEAGNIHPANKQEVGRRLALVANQKVYGKKNIASGPMYKSYKIKGDKVRIGFTHIGSGLSALNGQEVNGFAIAGDDKQFHWATAVIEGNEVVVYSDKVAKPVAVRYAWADNPVCNLVNSEGLPAVPFRTDDWKGITQR